MNAPLDRQALLSMTADIVAAHVGNNPVPPEDVATLIQTVHTALAALDDPEPIRAAPAVPVETSVGRDHLVCLEDGRRMKMLKRHLMTHYNLTPDQYRTKWNLPSDYPMVAPAYAEQRRFLAKQIGLGTKPRRV